MTSLKISGITINSQLSVGEYISSVMSSGTHTAYAVMILRAHGTCRESLRLDFRSVVIAKLLYAASAWWKFTIATHRQRLEAFVKRAVLTGLRSTTAADLSHDALFECALINPHHLLHQLLPQRPATRP